MIQHSSWECVRAETIITSICLTSVSTSPWNPEHPSTVVDVLLKRHIREMGHQSNEATFKTNVREHHQLRPQSHIKLRTSNESNVPGCNSHHASQKHDKHFDRSRTSISTLSIAKRTRRENRGEDGKLQLVGLGHVP